MTDTRPSLERVASVSTNNGQVFVSTQSSRPGVEQGIRYMTPFPGLMIVPEQNDVVEVHQLDDGSYVAYLAFNAPQEVIDGEYSMPDLGQREFHLQLDGGTALSFQSNGDAYDVSIKASNQVNLTASGPIKVDGDSIELGANTNPLVTDIELTKDSDGHVTDVTLVKTTKMEGE